MLQSTTLPIQDLSQLSAQDMVQMIPEDHQLGDLAEVFKVFGDPTRLRILCALIPGEMCVRHISERLHMTQPAISHQLRVLKQHKLVRSRREGKHVFYGLDDDHVISILFQGLAHIGEKPAFVDQDDID